MYLRQHWETAALAECNEEHGERFIVLFTSPLFQTKGLGKDKNIKWGKTHIILLQHPILLLLHLVIIYYYLYTIDLNS